MDYGLKIAQSEPPGVKSGHAALKTPRPLYPQKRTSPADSWMSVLSKSGHRTYQGERIRHIAIMMGLAENDTETEARLVKFKNEMEKLGWSEGRNLRIPSCPLAKNPIDPTP
jgi:hypothetical protein